MSNKKLGFIGGTAITPFREIPDSIVVVDDGHIAYVGSRQAFPPDDKVEWFEINDHFIVPGFIDIHVHGGAGSDFMDATTRDFETICSYHARGGTTSLLATTAYHS